MASACGSGIDEDTAAIVEDGRFRVMGSGAVYVVDGASVTWCNLAEAEPDRVLAMHGMTVHVLGTGDSYDFGKRKPLPAND